MRWLPFLLLLSACDHVEVPGYDNAQRSMDLMTPVCRDGVQYLYGAYGHGSVVTPRMKPDGTTYTCTNKPVAFKQEPIG
jgi:hypothetical protein